jgi:hypothetical protein
MARVDDFKQARALAVKQLAVEKKDDLAQRSGWQKTPGGLRVPFLNRVYSVSLPNFDFIDEADPTADIPLQEQVLILHYLQGVKPVLKNKWIAYREIPGAAFYFGPFMKRAIEPLKKVFGQHPSALRQAAVKLDAILLPSGPCAFQFNVLPYAPIQIILWEGDDEFPAEANILFDASAGDYLLPEDAAWLASLTVYRLMALAR